MRRFRSWPLTGRFCRCQMLSTSRTLVGLVTVQQKTQGKINKHNAQTTFDQVYFEISNYPRQNAPRPTPLGTAPGIKIKAISTIILTYFPVLNPFEHFTITLVGRLRNFHFKIPVHFQ